MHSINRVLSKAINNTNKGIKTINKEVNNYTNVIKI